MPRRGAHPLTDSQCWFARFGKAEGQLQNVSVDPVKFLDCQGAPLLSPAHDPGTDDF
jgi:hypothetical protein